VTVTGSQASGSSTGPFVTIEEVPTAKVFDANELGEADVMLFPNPASRITSVRVGEEINKISIYTIQGQRVLERQYNGVNQTTLDVSGLANGTYFISIETEEERTTERLIIHN